MKSLLLCSFCSQKWKTPLRGPSEKKITHAGPILLVCLYILQQEEKLTREVMSKNLGLILTRAPKTMSSNAAPQYPQRVQESLHSDLLLFSPDHPHMTGVLPPTWRPRRRIWTNKLLSYFFWGDMNNCAFSLERALNRAEKQFHWCSV